MSAAPSLQQASSGGAAYASATRSAARGSRRGAVRVVTAAGRTKAALPPIQPTAAVLRVLLRSTKAVQPLRLYQGESRAPSGNGASPKSREDDTRLNGSSPPKREPSDAWPWCAAQCTRPT